MPKLELSEEEIQQVRYIYRNSLNHKTRQLVHFLLLKSKNYTNETIADILDVNIKSTFNWTVIFRECQLQALANLNYKGQTSKLQEFGEQLVF